MTYSPHPTTAGFYRLRLIRPDGTRVNQGIVSVLRSPNGLRVYLCGVAGSLDVADYQRHEFEKVEEA